jgi:hypothetical protein
MAADGTDPARYLPPHTSQLATSLSRAGVDDCLVASILALVNGASLGEATRTPAGHEPTTAGLVRTAVRMRDKLDDPATAHGEHQSGPLPAAAAGRIVALMCCSYVKRPSPGAPGWSPGRLRPGASGGTPRH